MPTRSLRFLAVLLGMLLPAAVLAASEYDVKAAFIHNMAKFVEWPGASEGPQQLCILGEDALAEAARMLQGQPIGRGTWDLPAVSARGNFQQCRVLFIGASEAPNLRRILDGVKGRPVLTVGDSEGFAAAGVMVNFYLEQNKVRFEINPDAANRAGLKFGSQLLKLARLVRDAGGAP
jgi:hypothetical protein